MRKEKCNRIFLVLISLMLGIVMFSGTASATIYYNEGFEGEGVNANPASSWYTYAEDGDFYVANVTSDHAYGGSQAFHLNDSGNDLTSWANFSFNTVTYYDTFYFRFQINRKHHNMSTVAIVDGSSQTLGSLIIMNTTIYFNNTGSNIMSATIDNLTWYRVYIDFNLTTDRIGCYVYNESDSGALLSYGWGDMEDGAGSYTTVQHIRFSAAPNTKGNTRTAIYIDDMRLAYTYINPNQAVTNMILTTIITMLGIAILISIVSIAYTGSLTPESLIMLAVVVIIGVVTITILNGLL